MMARKRGLRGVADELVMRLIACGVSFTLIYRLLFILYAEDRGLLPYGTNHLYTESRSLGRFRDDIDKTIRDARRSRRLDYSKKSFSLWTELLTLFDLVDKGKSSCGVHAYNGGLFDPEEHLFWQENVISDWYVARIVQKLGHAPDSTIPDSGDFRVDYRDLAIQHLGSVYESLLELEPKIATVKMIVVRKRSREGVNDRIIPESQAIESGFDKTGEEYDVGMVFLQNNKGERRSSGSYYTPDDIVTHIVEETLGPLCRRIDAELRRDIAVADDQQRKSLESEFDDRVLKLRVLDPAMGSGHFLLRACNYLAEEIATHEFARDEQSLGVTGNSAVLYWKRKVAENCLYGVDLNGLAVELAKLALWLETVAANRPLTFLNHHLRCGNSLVGPRIDDLGTLPSQGVFHKRFFATYVRKSMPAMLKPLGEIREI